MKRLILMRHAKSSWSDRNQPDRARPLNPRGRRAAPKLGTWLRDQGYAPDVALVSDAVRTEETWRAVADALEPHPMLPQPKLYGADPATMLALLRGAGDAGTVLMIGHQPGIGALAQSLLRSPPAEIDPDRFPTGATVVMEFDAPDWTVVAPQSARLLAYVTPRQLD